MSTFARYLGYRLKNTAFSTLVITVISVIISFIIIPAAVSQEVYYDYDLSYVECGMYVLAFVMYTICTLIPMLETSAFKNKRNLDTLYFFPIKREKLATVHFLSGFIQVLFIYTVTYLLATVYLCINAPFMNLEYLIPLYFATVGLGFVIYSFFIFIFTQANTTADGVIFSLTWMYVFIIVLANINTLLNIDLDEYWGFVYSPLHKAARYFEYHIELQPLSEYMINDMKGIESDWLYFLAWGVVGVLCAVGYIASFVKKGAEKAGDISDSVFGYKTLIPFFLYSSLFRGGWLNSLNVILYIGAVISYIIYRRGVKFKKSDIICLICGIIPILLSEWL